MTTSVALASLAGLVAATALSVHHDSSVALSASLVAMVGFTLSSTLFLGSLRSGRFSSSGASPSEMAGADGGATGLDELKRRRLAEVKACIVENEAMMDGDAPSAGERRPLDLAGNACVRPGLRMAERLNAPGSDGR